ncbi:MAG: hypothetical protein KME23_24225 [Goleter apudmare HA4340-LM2]|jgi:hypothetical protein|nr:hypothetical protein [Goleter apudmare HA4340-LM2]
MNFLKRLGILLGICATTLSTQTYPALAGLKQFRENFESPRQGSADWFFAGTANFDNGKGLARQGKGNAWVRSTTGWNAINHWISVAPNSECSAIAWIRMSQNLTDGYMSIRGDDRTGNFNVINERKIVYAKMSLPGLGDDVFAQHYNYYQFKFNSGNNTRVLFYVGLWGNGRDSWMQIDDVAISCQTPY